MQETLEAIGIGGRNGSASESQASNNAPKRIPVCKNDRAQGSRGVRVDGRTGIEVNSRRRLSRREITVEIAAKEYSWSWDRRQGISAAAIAAREGVAVGRVRFGVARARAQEEATDVTSAVRPPRLVPLFPIGAYTPQSSCGHRRPIEPGSSLCCMVCHTSGMDRHPALRRDPRTDPAPEPKPKPAPERANSRRETRRERRRRLFGARS
jgi:hypothetical protein